MSHFWWQCFSEITFTLSGLVELCIILCVSLGYIVFLYCFIAAQTNFEITVNNAKVKDLDNKCIGGDISLPVFFNYSLVSLNLLSRHLERKWAN